MLHAPWLAGASCRDGPPVSGPGIYIPPAVTAVSPSSPAVLSVLAPLPSPGWRLATAGRATADSLQFRLETAAAGARATGLLQALGG